MSTASTIEWTEATWNPLVGCTKVSAGCKFCYAERMAGRLRAMALALEAEGRDAGRKSHYVNAVRPDGRWSRKVTLVEESLEDPAKWKKARRVFVNSMSDLFHENVPKGYIRRIFDVMRHAEQHTFQILTKRPERAAMLAGSLPWPANVWMGTSVESERVVARVSELRRIPARVRFLSLEPLLGPLPSLDFDGIHWVIVGGESGPDARPVDAAWIRDLRDRALASKVPFFFKQWGGKNKKASGRVLDGRTWDAMPK